MSIHQITRTNSHDYQNAPSASVRRCSDAHSTVRHTSALEVGTGLKMHTVQPADDCLLCGSQLPSAWQIANPGTDVCERCAGPELPGAA